MNISKLSIAAVAVIALASSAQATLKSEKVTLKGNMIVKFNKLPAPVDNVKAAFSEGMFYGRLRSNTFLWDWDKQTAKNKTNRHWGLGASLVYKSAPLNGFSGTVGMYTTQNPGFYRTEPGDIGSSKAGKDTFSRQHVKTNGEYGMTVLGQAYLQYDFGKSNIKVGRQMLETVFTKSNDTKMIPNAFDGVTATIKSLPKTKIQLAYFSAQKLRDHTVSHDVVAFNPANSWGENDDSAINKSLTVDKVGDDNSLIVASVTNKSIKNLKANVSYASVPGVVNNLTLEGHYAIPVGDWKVKPGVRYMQQMDDLGSTTDVACLKGGSKAHGYTNATSLDSSLLALRLDLKKGAFLGRLGYSHIADEADIVAPWRGFPTGGFTRAMAQYNWYANTKTYMLRAGYDFGKAKMIPGFSIMARYAIQDFDDAKDNVAADSTIIHVDARKNFGNDLELKVRVGIVTGDDSIVKSNGSLKAANSYNEYRVELNYFF